MIVRCILLVSLILTHHAAILVEGRLDMASMLTKEEELDIERQLNILNKAPIKTMHAPWGDVYDCIEFHKQPAFDHPLLKDYKIEVKKDLVFSNSFNMSGNQLDRCPKGTVPIRRTTREDLTRPKLSPNSMGNQYRAGASYEAKLGETIYGASGVVNVWNPHVSQDQFSSAEIALQSGSQDEMNLIKFGWTVNPVLYGDYVTRSFIYWTADGGKNTGCYNTLCSGFVQVHSVYTPDMPYSKTSEIGGTQEYSIAQITLDKAERKWWLTIQGNIRVGYWPDTLFPAFAPGATSIFWGGRVKSNNDGMSPPMSSGQPIGSHPADSGSIDTLQVVDMNNAYSIPEKMELTIDCLEHYDAKYYPDQNILLYGGSGGVCNTN
ncbi:hypothetical protein MKW92_050496 [Papaver armeniacum]|nr:hypothetical protein MKW92_050496 [Papaver armeniacum]